MTRLLTNCFAYTGDATHRCIPDAAIRIAGDHIAWIGPRDTLPPGRDDASTDLGGRVDRKSVV